MGFLFPNYVLGFFTQAGNVSPDAVQPHVLTLLAASCLPSHSWYFFTLRPNTGNDNFISVIWVNVDLSHSWKKDASRKKWTACTQLHQMFFPVSSRSSLQEAACFMAQGGNLLIIPISFAHLLPAEFSLALRQIVNIEPLSTRLQSMKL